MHQDKDHPELSKVNGEGTGEREGEAEGAELSDSFPAMLTKELHCTIFSGGSTDYVSGTVVGAGDREVNKTSNVVTE